MGISSLTARARSVAANAVASVVCPVMQPLEQRRLFAAGAPDASFGVGGIVLASAAAKAAAVEGAVQADGKLVVVGSAGSALGGSGGDVLVSRFLADGSLDAGFGVAGVVTLDLGADEVATGVVALPDGRIFVSGLTGNLNDEQSDFFAVMFKGDGSLDTSFNGTGKRTMDLGGLDVALGATYDPVGQTLYLAGTRVSGVSVGIAVAALKLDGSFDTSFAGDGTLVTSAGLTTGEAAIDVAWAGDGLVVSGLSVALLTQKVRMLAAKIGPDGKLVSGFGSSGRVTLAFNKQIAVGTSLAIDSATGQIAVVGTDADGTISLSASALIGGLGDGITSANVAVAVLRRDGSTLATFSGDGKVTTPAPVSASLATATGAVWQGDGKLVVAGAVQTGTAAAATSDVLVLRYTANGALDTTFGTTGIVTTDLGGRDGALDLAATASGDVVAIGSSTTGSGDTLASQVALVKYTTEAVATTPGLSVADAAAAEPSGGGSLVFTVTLSAASASAVTVHYATSDGVATAGGGSDGGLAAALAGTHYTATSGDLVVAPGEVVKTVSVPYSGPANADGVARGLTLMLSGATAATLADAVAIGTLGTAVPVTPNDLSVASVALTQVPARVVGGTKTAKGLVLVTLRNDTQAALKGVANVSITGATDGVFDAATNLALGSAKVKLNLKPGASVTSKVKVVFPATSVDGALTVFASATGTGVSSPSLAVKAVAGTTLLEAPRVTLIGANGALPALAVSAKKSTKLGVPVTLTNVGNVDAKGRGTFEVRLIDSNGVTAATYSPRTLALSVKAGQTRVIKLALSSVTALTAGSYTLEVTLEQTQLTGGTPNGTDGNPLGTGAVTVG